MKDLERIKKLSDEDRKELLALRDELGSCLSMMKGEIQAIKENLTKQYDKERRKIEEEFNADLKDPSLLLLEDDKDE